MIRLWDVETGQELCRFNGYAGITYVAVSPDGRWLLSSAWDSHDLRLWDVATGRCLQRIVWPSWACRGSFTPDSSHAVWGGYDGIIRMYRLMGTDQRSTKGAAASGTGASQSPKPEGHQRVENSIGMKLMLIAAGEFLMGSADDAIEAEADEKPRHRVRITKPFYLGTCEVTQGQYEAVMGKNPSYFSLTGGGADQVGGQLTAQYPVENVSWFDAIRFCNKLSEKERKKPFYEIDGADVRVPDWNGQGYRLPTEAEWEYACRAGTSTVFSFGVTRTQLREYGWFDENSERRTHPVGQKRPNPFGLHDMYGNVWEWCWDWHRPEFYAQPPTDDPTGPVAEVRILRGGGISQGPAWLPVGQPPLCRRRGDCGPTMASERPVGLLTAELRRAERGATPKRSRSKAVRVRIRFRRPDRASIIGRRGEAACHRELTLLSRPQPRRGKFTPGVAFRLR